MICFDASLASKWYWFEEHASQARALLAATLQQAEEIVEPHLLLSEMANIIHQRRRKEIMTVGEGLAVLAQLTALPMRFQTPLMLPSLALVYADRFRLRVAYDAHYLALCELTNATFWTADERLYGAVAGALPFVRRLADYTP